MDNPAGNGNGNGEGITPQVIHKTFIQFAIKTRKVRHIF